MQSKSHSFWSFWLLWNFFLLVFIIKVPLFVVLVAKASIKPVMSLYFHSWWAFPCTDSFLWATITAEPSNPYTGWPSEEKGSLSTGGVVTVNTSWGLQRRQIVLWEKNENNMSKMCFYLLKEFYSFELLIFQ